MEKVSEDESALRRQLRSLITLARDNEEKFRRFNDQELRLIAARTLPELVDLIVKELPKAFVLSQVTLTLVDPGARIAGIFEECGVGLGAEGRVGFVARPEEVARRLRTSNAPFLGVFDPEAHAAVFASSVRPPSSVALLPLVRGDALIGSLNLASADAQRYTRGSRTDFLERLAAVVAICLENCFSHHRLRQLSLMDALTGVNNRRYFEERLQEAVAHATRHKTPLACMFLDVDHFKHYNDTYGHQAGDDVLQRVAALMRSQLRRGDVLCRYGGEEFVALLPNTGRDSARETAERIREVIAGQSFFPDSAADVRVTVSIGIGIYRGLSKSPEAVADALVRAADEAVYAAKSRGRNQVVMGR